MSEQKFNGGDWVRIADDLGPTMSHFESGCDAIVVASYAEKYGGSQDHHANSYTVDIEHRGEVSWYGDENLTLIESGRNDLRAKWKAAREARSTKESDIDWIFEHGEEVLNGASGATIGALAKAMGMPEGALWGPRGEGVTYAINASKILQGAKPFLEIGDKDGFLTVVEGYEG